MHQLSCGVNDTVVIDGYRVQVLEVTADAVRLGLSTPGNDRIVHEITLPGRAPVNQTLWRDQSYSRPAVN